MAEEGCYFANTLVDRIVTGFPADEYAEICAKMGYEDKLRNLRALSLLGYPVPEGVG